MPLGVALNPDAVETHESFARDQGRPAPSTDPADWLKYVGFWRPDDHLSDSQRGGLRRQWRLFRQSIPVRNDHGQVRWQKPALDATIGQLVDASEWALFAGDPLRPYLIPSVPQGTSASPEAWIVIRDALVLAWTAAGAAAVLDGAAGLLDRVKDLRRRRSQGALDAMATRSAAWSERGVAPTDLAAMLALRPRTTSEVSALLGCTDSESEAILWVLGFVLIDRDGVWQHRADSAGDFLADEIEVVENWTVFGMKNDAILSRLAVERVQQFAAEGFAPDVRTAVDRILKEAARQGGSGQSEEQPHTDATRNADE
jgi:hypothetical protein